MILTKKWKIKEKNKVLSKYKQDLITIIGDQCLIIFHYQTTIYYISSPSNLFVRFAQSLTFFQTFFNHAWENERRNAWENTAFLIILSMRLIYERKYKIHSNYYCIKRMHERKKEWWKSRIYMFYFKSLNCINT